MAVQVWRSLAELPSRPDDATVVTIGVFDGVHRGHQEVLAVARALADARRLPLVALTFDPHPMAVVRPGLQPPAVTTLRHRIELLGAAGADEVLVLPFTAEVAAMSADDFVRHVLVERLAAAVVVVGEDFRFGHRASGDIEVLSDLGLAYGFDAIGVGPVGSDGHRWSSTEVRRRVQDGDVAGARTILGHWFRVEGTVVPGDRRGRALGYPTANLAFAPGALVPADGVYAGYVRVLDGRDADLPAAMSVGTNPTFDGTERRVEAYVLDAADLDLYGCDVALSFVAHLRGQERFDSPEDLRAQMARDVERTRTLLTEASPFRG
jgi:riboflavin kinase / FMN adenylyltransferase